MESYKKYEIGKIVAVVQGGIAMLSVTSDLVLKLGTLGVK